MEPEYYDLADDILNASRNRYAHLFNTKLLMKKNISPVEDSVANFIEVRNPVARQYFDYQLGRFHATMIEQVRKFENAMSKEGRVAVAMDGYFIRKDRIRYYYLGQETIELNRRKAEKKLSSLKEEQREHREELEGKTAKKSYLDTQLSLLTTCNYNACQEYETALAEHGKKESELQKLIDAQKNNMEYLRLAQTVSDLEQELAAIRKEISDVRADMSHQETEYNTNEKDYQIAEEIDRKV